MPVVEVIRPGRAPCRRGHPQRPGRRHRHPGHRTSRGPTTTPSPRRPHDRRSSSQACPRFVEFVEAGVTGGDELLDVAHEYLDPVAAAGVDTLVLGCTHYPLLTGVISYVMGDDVTLVSSAEETAKDVYRVLADARPELRPDELPAAVHRFLTTGDPDAFARAGPPLPRPRGRGRASTLDRAGRWPDAPMRLTVVGCSGSVPGPRLARVLLPREAEHEGRTWRVVLDLGNGALGALQQHIDPCDVDAVLLSHLHADHCLDLCGLYVVQQVPPRAARREPDPRLRPGRHRASGWRGPTTWPTSDAHGQRVRLPRPRRRRAGRGSARSASPRMRSNHPVEAYGLRVEADGRCLAYTGDTDALRRPSYRCAAAPTWCWPRRRSSSGRDTAARPPPDRGRGAPRPPTGAGGVGRLVLTHVPPWNDPEVCRAQAAARLGGRGRARRARRRLRPVRVREVRRGL